MNINDYAVLSRNDARDAELSTVLYTLSDCMCLSGLLALLLYDLMPLWTLRVKQLHAGVKRWT